MIRGASWQPPTTLRINRGMANNDWFAKFLGDLLCFPVARPAVTETTAWGAAILAGLQCGFSDPLEEIRRGSQATHIFTPSIDDRQHDQLLLGWRRAAAQVRAVQPTYAWRSASGIAAGPDIVNSPNELRSSGAQFRRADRSKHPHVAGDDP